MSSVLFNDPPLVISPSLAVMLGSVNEAIVLQQLHYWLKHSKNERDGRMWVYNTAKDWQEQFPFWSEDSIWRIMKSLKEKGYIITGSFNKMPTDRTTWYSIDYNKLDSDSANPRNGIPIPRIREMTNRENAECNQRIPETTKDVVVVDEARGKVIQLFKDNMPGSLTPIIADQLNDLIDTYGSGEVALSITRACEANARNLRYITAILANRAAGKDKPQKEQRNYGSNRQANTSSSKYTASADEGYELPAKWR